MSKTTPRASSQRPFWHALRRGFHQRRVGNRNIGFECFVWRGGPGPTLLMNAGTHGNEYEGPTFLHELARDWRPKNLAGTVVALPVLNENAYFAGRRCSEADGKNLARVFPGKPDGTHTERIAYLFRTRMLRFADFYADFHSAGTSYEILPWVGYPLVDDKTVMGHQRRMAQCFPEYWCWSTRGLPGRTLSTAAELGIPAIYTESRGKGSVAPDDLQVLRRSTTRMLKALGLMPGRVQLRPQKVTREINDRYEAHLQWQHPAPCHGLVIDPAPIGTKRRKGQPLCALQPLTGGKPIPVKAMRSGTVVFIRRQRSVEKGESLGTVVPMTSATGQTTLKRGAHSAQEDRL